MTTDIKPTLDPAQLALLKHLSPSRDIVRRDGVKWFCSASREIANHKVDSVAIEALLANKLIGLHEKGGGREAFVITDAGRAAVQVGKVGS